MIISDFAIKRPLITVVAMVAMVIFGLFALFKLKTDEFPDVDPPFLTVGHRLSGRVARRRRERSAQAGRGADRLDLRRQAHHGQGVRRLLDGHDRVLLRQGPERGVAGRARRDLDDPLGSADGDEGADRPEVQRHGSADRVARHLVDRAFAAGADAAGRSGDHARAARASRRRRRADLRQGRARADGRSRPAQAPGGEHQRRRGGAGASAAEPRRAGGPRERRPRRTRDSPARASREPGGVREPRRRRSKRDAHAARAGRDDQGRDRGAAHARALQRQGSDRHRRQEGEGLQHDRRRQPRARRGWRRSSRRCPRARSSTW